MTFGEDDRDDMADDDDDIFDDAPQLVRYPMALGPKAPPKWGESVSVTALPMRGGQVQRLLVSSSVARFYQVENLSVASEPMMAGVVPGEMFDEHAHGVRLDVTYKPGNPITLTARALKPAPAKIFAIAWWVRWFTREGWRDRTPRKPPPFQACLIVGQVE